MIRRLLLSLAFSVLSVYSYLPSEKALWYGTVKFPADITIDEPIKVFYAGDRIQTEIEHEAHQVSFAIHEYKMRNSFCLLICNDIETVCEKNTIRFQRVREGRPYKLYVLQFKPNKDQQHAHHDTDIQALGTWDITQKTLQKDRRIPDNAIIVHYHPHLVQNVHGGNALELPKIILNEQVMRKFSQEELHDASIHFLLSSLDQRTIHAQQEKQTKADFAHNRVISIMA